MGTIDQHYTNGPKPGEIICYGQFNRGNGCQEHYESESRHAGRRARDLRKRGYRVIVSPLGAQVTRVGLVNMTLVTIEPGTRADTVYLPPVRVERAAAIKDAIAKATNTGGK
ncbi:hypothetical protein LCGC14_0552080 [marine sediment metagenome]|uniref:Uncharacterized protein n=1 Tax=marine sediment metagenome TaxID=412755 RepID=A0A0F9RPE7_9ZZZZ